MITIHRGLEGVHVAQTRLSRVDGATGELLLAGEPVEALAGKITVEAAVARLWQTAGIPGTIDLGAARLRAHARLNATSEILKQADGMAAIQAGIATMNCKTPADILGAVAVLTGAWWRTQNDQPPLTPDPTADHAADLLRLLTGATDPERAAALSAYLVAVMDHGLNASTFTARVVASTASDDSAAVIAAISALKGPLHGGAPGPVLDMLDDIASPERAGPWIAAELTAGRRIMGMGHRVYRVRDPRAAVLEAATRRLSAVGIGGQRLTLARAVESAAVALLAEAKPDRAIFANVEFATAVLLEAVGVDRRVFAMLFACSRTAGWLAHAAEERRDGRLMRPRAEYIGSTPS
ncbi:MAG: citrate synthase [Myxococcota bacterium]|jgi:citrate synthase